MNILWLYNRIGYLYLDTICFKKVVDVFALCIVVGSKTVIALIFKYVLNFFLMHTLQYAAQR